MYNKTTLSGGFMVKNLKLSKKLIAGAIIASIIGTGIGGYHMHKQSEIARVKGYLTDYLTADNYVDLSKVTGTYDIKSFDGEYLKEALEEMDIDYVRINDSFIYDKAHVETFPHVNAVNYDKVVWNDGTNDIYEMYEPIRIPSENGVTYQIPEGFVLETVEEIAEPIRYDDLDDREVVVFKNTYEDSYSLSLEKK